MKDIIFFDKMWLESAHGGDGSSLLLSVNISKVAGLKPYCEEKPFFIELQNSAGVIGYIEVKRLAVMQNEAVFEAIALHSADFQFHDEQRPLIALSSHLLGGSLA